MSQENYLYYLEKAIEKYKNKDYDFALSLLNEAIQENYNVPQLHYWIGKVYAEELTEERLKTAIISFTEAIELKPDYADALFERGKLYLRTGDTDKAIADIEKAIEFGIKDKDVFIHLSQAYMLKGNREKALELLKKISSEEDIDFLINISRVLIETENYEEALSYLKKAKGIDKNDVYVYELMAKAYEGLGEYLKAIEELKAAAFLNPSEDEYFKQIARDFIKQAEIEKEGGNIKKAGKYIALAIDIDYDVPLEERHKKLIKEAINMCLTEGKPKEALSFVDCIERMADVDEEILELKRRAFKELPVKEKIIRLITDIYTK